jgi:hypothetical protein
VTVYALVSAGGAPGVTTTALALALTWPRHVMVAETDPSGGDVLAGFFAGHVEGDRSLLRVAYDATTVEAAAAAVADQLVPFDSAGTRMLLPGLPDPRHAATLSMTWHLLAGALAAQPADVLADCGRLDGGPGQEQVLRVAAKIVMVLRPTLRQVAAARPRVEMISQLSSRADCRLGVLLTGSGPLSPREISAALSVPVLGKLPDDPKAAHLLSDGAQQRRDISGSALLRAARVAARQLATSAEAARDGAKVTAGQS